MRVSMNDSPPISVNARGAALIERVRADAAELRVLVEKGELGETLIDAGNRCQGGIAAGLRLAEICMGGLRTIDVPARAPTPNWPWTPTRRPAHPGISRPARP